VIPLGSISDSSSLGLLTLVVVVRLGDYFYPQPS
jgi:hypothetical protein